MNIKQSDDSCSEAPPKYETLLVDKEGGIDWLTLNRPEGLNTLTPQMCTVMSLRLSFRRRLQLNATTIGRA